MNFLDPRLPARFWSKCIPEPMSGCWLWTASLNRQGYGRYSFRAQRMGYVGAHRASFIALVGPIDEGLEIDHRCNTPSCVNPAHLRAVTHLENMHRAHNIARNIAATHCPYGHPYDEANTKTVIVAGRPRRQCRACAKHRKDSKPVLVVQREPRKVCGKGHLFTSDNAYVNPKTGHRQCMECRRLADRKRRPAGSHPEQRETAVVEVSMACFRYLDATALRRGVSIRQVADELIGGGLDAELARN